MSRPWLVRRLPVIVVSFSLVLVGMISTTGGAHLIGHGGWGLPNDLWATLVAAERMVHGDFSHLYTPPTALVAPPGTPLVVLPAAALVMVLGLTPGPPVTQSLTPSAWWVAGTYEIAVSCLVLFAADALAERMGVTLGRRAVLAIGEAVALWNVSVRWGHPEDAVAVALLLYALVALADGRVERSGWLVGAGVAVQPLILLALPVVLAAVGTRQVVRYAARAVGPLVAVVAGALAANWRATWHAVTAQPNYPSVDHPTPWIRWAPHLASGVVAAGPGRIAALVIAALCGAVLMRRTPPPVPWSAAELGGLVWWVAVALGLRIAFESVMVAYYLWPPLAVALVSASPRMVRLVSASVLAGVVTFVSQATWRGEWVWWPPMLLGVVAVVVVARSPQGSQATWPWRRTYPTNAPVSMSAWAMTSRGSRR